MHHFFERCRNSNNVGFRALMRQIVYIRHCLNTATAFYFVTECSDVAVFFRLRICECHNTSVLYLALTRVGLSVLLWM